MNKNGSVLLIVGLGVALVLGLYGTFRPAKSEVRSEVIREVPSVGAVPTLDGIDLGKYRIGGVEGYLWAQSMTATSTGVCSVRPWALLGATSTLAADSLGVKVATNPDLTAQELNIATSTNTGGTTTPSIIRVVTIPVGQSYQMFNLASNALATSGVQISPYRAGTAVSEILFGPNDYVNFRRATSSAQTQSSYWTGTCQADFVKI